MSKLNQTLHQTMWRLLSIFFIFTIALAGCKVNSGTFNDSHKLFEKRQHLKGYHFRGGNRTFSKSKMKSHKSRVLLGGGIESLPDIDLGANFSIQSQENQEVLKLLLMENSPRQDICINGNIENLFSTSIEPITNVEVPPSDTTKLSQEDKEEIASLKKKMTNRGKWGAFFVSLGIFFGIPAFYVFYEFALPSLTSVLFTASLLLGTTGLILLILCLCLRRRIKREYGEVLEKIKIYKVFAIPFLASAFILSFIFGASFAIWSIITLIELEGFAVLLFPLFLGTLVVGFFVLGGALAIFGFLLSMIFDNRTNE